MAGYSRVVAERKQTRPARAIHIDEIEGLAGPDTLTWHPVRATLGIRAFGTNAYTAAKPGLDVVEPHTENPDLAHEELPDPASRRGGPRARPRRGDGRTTFAFANGVADDYGAAVALRKGTILVAGTSNQGGTTGYEFALARLLSR